MWSYSIKSVDATPHLEIAFIVHHFTLRSDGGNNEPKNQAEFGIRGMGFYTCAKTCDEKALLVLPLCQPQHPSDVVAQQIATTRDL